MNIGVEHTAKPKLPDLMAGFNASAAYEKTPGPRKLTANEELGRQKSGYVIENISIVGNIGEYSKDNEDDENSKKKKHRDRATSRMFDWNTSSVLSSLTNSIKFDEELMSMKFYKPVEQKDMLRNDKGEIVKTLEEKQEMERRGKNCSAMLSQDEIAHDPKTGMMLSKYDAMANMMIQERIDSKKEIFAKIEKGEMKIEDLPDDMKKELTEHKYGKAATFYDRINITQGLLSLKHTETDKTFDTPATKTLRQEPYIAAPAPAPAPAI